METKYGLYSKVNDSPFYMPDAITLLDIIGESKIHSGCSLFDKQKKRLFKRCMNC